MGKRLTVVFLAIGLFATSNAFASRARTLVLGTGDGGVFLGSTGNAGSWFYEESYNIFHNPAYVNDYKNWATIEKSNYAGGGAQGGFVTSFSPVNVGVYFNRVDAMPAMVNRLNMRPIDLIVGGDMGVKWGLMLTYGSYRQASRIAPTTNRDSDMDLTLRGGISIADFEPFFSYRIIGEESTSTDRGSHRGYSVGMKYHWGEWTPYAAWRMEKREGRTMANVAGLGLGRSTKVGEGARLNYAVGFMRVMDTDGIAQGTGLVNGAVQSSTNTMNTGGAVAGIENGNRNIVPVDLSLEVDATSWLTVRGGVTYRLSDQIAGVSQADSSSGRIGAGFHWGKADMDFAVGTANGAEGGAGLNDQAFGTSTGFFSAASLSYRW